MMTKEVLGSEEAMMSYSMRQPYKEYIIIIFLHNFIIAWFYFISQLCCFNNIAREVMEFQLSYVLTSSACSIML